MANLLETLGHLRELRPSFTSCTYGAGGSTRAKTLEVTLKIKEQFSLEAMAHFTCVGQRLTEIDKILEDFSRHGIENVLALRGDRPVGVPEPPESWFPDFKNAVHLIRHLRKSGNQPSRSEEHTSELQSLRHLVCRLLLEKKKKNKKTQQQTK